MTMHDYLWTYGKVRLNPGVDGTPPASVVITAWADGIITKVNCVTDTMVKQGQVLFQMDDRQAKLELDDARQQLEFCRQNLDRQEKLRRISGTSQKDYQLASQQLKNAQKQMDRAQLNLSFLTVKAPVAGMVEKINVRPGQAVTATDSLVEINDYNSLVVDVDVPAREIAQVKIGQPVTLTTDTTGIKSRRLESAATKGTNDARKDKVVQGKVEFIKKRIDPASDTVAVRISIPEQTSLQTGQFVAARILCREKADCLAVPQESVVLRKDGKAAIAIVENGKARQKVITLGIKEQEMVEIKADNITEATTVVTVGAYGLPEITKVTIETL